MALQPDSGFCCCDGGRGVGWGRRHLLPLRSSSLSSTAPSTFPLVMQHAPTRASCSLNLPCTPGSSGKEGVGVSLAPHPQLCWEDSRESRRRLSLGVGSFPSFREEWWDETRRALGQEWAIVQERSTAASQRRELSVGLSGPTHSIPGHRLSGTGALLTPYFRAELGYE